MLDAVDAIKDSEHTQQPVKDSFGIAPGTEKSISNENGRVGRNKSSGLIHRPLVILKERWKR